MLGKLTFRDTENDLEHSKDFMLILCHLYDSFDCDSFIDPFGCDLFIWLACDHDSFIRLIWFKCFYMPLLHNSFVVIWFWKWFILHFYTQIIDFFCDYYYLYFFTWFSHYSDSSSNVILSRFNLFSHLFLLHDSSSRVISVTRFICFYAWFFHMIQLYTWFTIHWFSYTIHLHY